MGWQTFLSSCIVCTRYSVSPVTALPSTEKMNCAKFLSNEYILCVSTEILFEYEEILQQKSSPVAADLFMKVIARSRNVERKDPYFHLFLVKQDFDDNKFVDCAFVCQADLIVTDDSHFKDVIDSKFLTFRVMNLDEFAERMEDQSTT